ncbi:YHS domain protein [Flavobacterium sp. 9AF]|uniref:YHS domain-containing (seleno)protein n=1 Tax=Flavobacterium sp. 9AF TaxID=2653142 RepID=UPI0012F11F5B|nr:YHS domain-containing (seleno)protein [Flavobacterium sp. 9AF]VXC16100.1 YHS domain protein [Flavobacterium sp. 9AF]
MKKSVYLILLLFNGLQLIAQQNISHFNVKKDKIAVEGYDVVAYFLDHKAIKGSKEFTVKEDGIIYYFTSQMHKEVFEKNSSLYKPQYGGWCAYAIGKTGEKVEIDPKTFKIVDNKLYLFYNKFLTNTLQLWNKEEAHLKMEADMHWKKIISK